MSQGLRWVIDLDIEKYFDSISHSHLRDFLDSRVTDGVIRRMIDKWLKAGVLEDELLRHATEGSPQALAAVTDWCRTHRHLSIPEQHAQLVAKMRGHYAYYGISGNFRRLSCP